MGFILNRIYGLIVQGWSSNIHETVSCLPRCINLICMRATVGLYRWETQLRWTLNIRHPHTHYRYHYKNLRMFFVQFLRLKCLADTINGIIRCRLCVFDTAKCRIPRCAFKCKQGWLFVWHMLIMTTMKVDCVPTYIFSVCWILTLNNGRYPIVEINFSCD